MPGLPYDFVLGQRSKQEERPAPLGAHSPLSSQPSTPTLSAAAPAYDAHAREMRVVRFLMALYPQLR